MAGGGAGLCGAHLVRYHMEVGMAAHDVRNGFHLVGAEDLAGRIVRRVEHQELASWCDLFSTGANFSKRLETAVAGRIGVWPESPGLPSPARGPRLAHAHGPRLAAHGLRLAAAGANRRWSEPLYELAASPQPRSAPDLRSTASPSRPLAAVRGRPCLRRSGPAHSTGQMPARVARPDSSVLKCRAEHE